MASLTAKERTAWLASLTEEQAKQLHYCWKFFAREDQIRPDGDWSTWLIVAGRGWGKTRTGAEYVRDLVESGQARRIALVGATSADARDVMVEGQSGLLACSPPWNRPTYEPSKRRVTWPNGALATTYSADEPDRLRGPQHDAAWCDELAAWRYEDAWDQLRFGLRLGDNPRIVVTTTPRPTPIVKNLMKENSTITTRGSTYANKGNLAPAFFANIVAKYDGTRLGRQEIHAEILDDVLGALWNHAGIDRLRVPDHGDLKRIVVAVDPAVTSHEDSDETGIVVSGVGRDDHAYVLADLSGRMTPNEWASVAVQAYKDFAADRIVAEVNNGGDLVEHTVRTVDKTVSYKSVRATRGKMIRAEPIAALYEQNKVHHVGMFALMEDQLCSWTPGQKSPDRMDALVWGLTDLMLGDTFEDNLRMDLSFGLKTENWRY